MQQQALAQTVAAHLPACLSAPSTAVQLAACQVITAYQQAAHTKPCLHSASDICAKLVEMNAQMQEVTIAPALQCMGLLSEAAADNADAIVRAHGLQQIVHTLEEDCPAQVCRLHIIRQHTPLFLDMHDLLAVVVCYNSLCRHQVIKLSVVSRLALTTGPLQACNKCVVGKYSGQASVSVPAGAARGAGDHV